MPEYEPTVWVNETPQTTPIKVKITDDVEGVLATSAKIEVVTPITPGTPVDATRLNKIEQGIKAASDAVDALGDEIAAGPARCKVTRTTPQSIPNNAVTAVTFTSEVFDTAGMFPGSGTEVTIPADGLYLVLAQALFASNATGTVRQASVKRVGGSNVAFTNRAPAPSGHYSQLSASCITLFSEGDRLTMEVFQNSGGALDLSVAYGAPSLTVVRLA